MHMVSGSPRPILRSSFSRLDIPESRSSRDTQYNHSTDEKSRESPTSSIHVYVIRQTQSLLKKLTTQHNPSSYDTTPPDTIRF